MTNLDTLQRLVEQKKINPVKIELGPELVTLTITGSIDGEYHKIRLSRFVRNGFTLDENLEMLIGGAIAELSENTTLFGKEFHP